jgi:hypothetical protein
MWSSTWLLPSKTSENRLTILVHLRIGNDPCIYGHKKGQPKLPFFDFVMQQKTWNVNCKPGRMRCTGEKRCGGAPMF